MAGTICNFKSLIPARLPFSSAGGVCPSRTVSGPNHSTSIRARSQAAPASLLSGPVRIAISKTAKTALELHPSGGATVSLTFGDLTGQDRFAVSIYPERSVVLTTLPTGECVVEFVLLNLPLLLRQDHALGTWFDRANATHVLDVVVCLPCVRTALELGRKSGQVSVFDLANLQEIVIGIPPRECNEKEIDLRGLRLFPAAGKEAE